MPVPFHRILAPCLAALLLAACGSSGWDAPYREYLQRLSRTLDTPYTDALVTPPERVPRTALIRLEFDSDRLDGLDFLALHGCELQLTIGKKNSSLGRLARDSQRLLLELEYLQLAPGCVAQLRGEGKHTLAATLQQAWTDKHRQLPGRIFNATLGSAEYRELWQLKSPSGDYPDNTSSAPVQALEQVNSLVERWLGGDYRFDNRDFEILLSEIAKADGGQLWYALATQDAWLASANGVLQDRRRQGPLCAANYRPAAADIMPNVIARFFVDGTQARAAKLGRRYHELLPAVRSLEQLLEETLPQAYAAWRSERDSRLEQLATAPAGHVAELQALLGPCETLAP